MVEKTSPAASLDLTGKRALVTGGSRGIGAAVARLLASAGAEVLLNFRQDAASAERTAAALGGARLLPANLVHPEEIRTLISAATEGGPLDILVHAAALGSFKPVLGLRHNQWDLSMNVNARALLTLAQEAAPRMPRGGKIVSLSSLGSKRVIPEYGAIGISKAAMEATTRALAVELSPRGVNVNAVSAGLVDVPSVKAHPRYAELERTCLERTPLGRLATADDVARVVLFLVSPLADWITGQTLVADGGLSLVL